MENKKIRVNFSLNESVVKLFREFSNKKAINKSALVQMLILEYIKDNEN